MTQLATYSRNDTGPGNVTVRALVWDDILNALELNRRAWEDEEPSVKVEHAELIEELDRLASYLSAHGCGKSDTLPEAPPTRVLVALEGGLVQGAVADRPGVSVLVLDYDTEGADADGVYSIPQDSGGFAEACRGGVSCSHDPAFIDAAEAAELADPARAARQLRREAKQAEQFTFREEASRERYIAEKIAEAEKIETQLASEGLTEAAPDAAPSRRARAMIRLQYRPTARSRAWRNSSLTMHAAAFDNLRLNIAPALSRQEGWHDWRIVSA